MTPGQSSRTFVELFAGGGMARLGLGPGWRCLLANDIDEGKAASYRNNHSAAGLFIGDIRKLRVEQVVGRPDLLWSSSPCQDISSAGSHGGLDSARSGALWPALDFLRQLSGLRREPRLVVIENVLGMATSRSGADLFAVMSALRKVKYRVGALVVDAKLFVPQSRPRLFIVGIAPDVGIPPNVVSGGPVRPWHPAPLVAAATRCDQWIWWNPAVPPPLRTELWDMLDEGDNVLWHTSEQTTSILRLVWEKDLEKLETARYHGRVVGTMTRKTRRDPEGERRQRNELRTDGMAWCLLTAGGGSSQQAIINADANGIRTRQMRPQEAARLMGLPETYRLPRRRVEALNLIGDGVAVPVVRFLANCLFEPLLAAVVPSTTASVRTGIKASTRSTTLYLLPEELQRLKHLAVKLDVSLHDLMLRGLDHVLSEDRQRPLDRYC